MLHSLLSLGVLVSALGGAAAQGQTCQKTANAATCEVLCANGATFDLSPLHKPSVPYEVKDFDAVEGLDDASLANYSYIFNICGEVATVRCARCAGLSAGALGATPPPRPLCSPPFALTLPFARHLLALVLSSSRCRALVRTARQIRAQRRKATRLRRAARQCNSPGWRRPSKSRTGSSLATICATGWARRRPRPRCSGRSSRRAIRPVASR